MKVSLRNQTPIKLPGIFRQASVQFLMVLALLFSADNPIWAEGSKDFVNYPGYRMFLDTRDAQQLKVYASAGEVINVGSSHVGLQGGFISVYRPDGTLAATFDNTGVSSGLGIINNNVQELAGPTGGGSTNGTGYIPGTVSVTAGNAGIWTVVFDYPSYVNTGFTNLLNNAPWTRASNQPNSRRVVLAWDITVTTGGAGNTGGSAREGRVYSNEHISLINGNGFNTSPIFYVLTDDGYLYQVDINDADPFRFPISSNSLGLVNGDGEPTYKSKPESAFTRDDDPGTWLSNNLYLYEPQAMDDAGLGLINNKIFFNVPDAGLPASATVTDIFRGNTHTTWLYGALQVLNLNSTSIVGANPGGSPCAAGSFQFGKGGYFIFDTNTGGSITLQLDLNNNGSYNDPVDVTIEGVLANGIDSIFWDGLDGLGVPIPIQPSFEFNYQGTIRFGELHIALTDVENNPGGVTFSWLNAPAGYPTDQFYYDHSDIAGPVSGGGTSGNALPTTTPYMYSGNAGNDQYLDQWFFIEFTITNTPIIINIVENCVCENATPQLTGTSPADVCAGQDLVMTATNSVTGLGALTYSWSGPAGYSFVDPLVAVTGTSTATVNNVTAANAGTYQVIAATSVGCSDTLSFAVAVNPAPSVPVIIGSGPYCAGETVTLFATNTVAGIDSVSYVWSGPSVPANQATGTVAGDAQITLTIPNIQETGEGDYTLILTSGLGCVSDPDVASVVVNPTPVLTPVSGGGSYCFGDDVTLVASNSATGFTTMSCTWSGPNALNITQTVNSGDPITLPLTNIDNTLEGIYTLICVATSVSTTCNSNAITFDVVVNANPEINAISPNGDFCEGSSVTFTALNNMPGTGPITYTWNGPNPLNTIFPYRVVGAVEGGPFPVTIPNLTLADAGTYTLILETEGGCQSVAQSVTIDVLPAPSITVTGGGDACNGQDVTLTATNNTTGLGLINYVWTGPNTTVVAQGSTNGNAPVELVLNDVDDSVEGVYTVTMTDQTTGCSATQNVTLNVLPGLNLIDITPDTTLCEFADLVLTATNTVGTGTVTYTWTAPNGQAFPSVTVNSNEPLVQIINSISVQQSGTWTLDVTSSTGCNATISVEVTVLPGVRITDITGDGQYCFNEEVVLTGVGQGSADSVTYTWTDPNNVVIGSGTTTPAGPFTASSNANLPGTYILNVVAVGSGCSDAESASITFNALPEVIVLNNDTTLCNNDTLQVCGQAIGTIGAFTYSWLTPSGQTITGTGNGNTPFCNTVSPLGTYGEGPWVLTITANGCTSEPDAFTLTLNPNPTISSLSGGGTYCAGQTANICFTNTNPEVVGFFYTCIFPDGTQTSGQTSTNEQICIPVTTSGSVCCSIESFDGCVSSIACTSVTFEPSANLTATANTPVCANDTLVLTGTNSLPCSGIFTFAWIGPNGSPVIGTAPCGGPFVANIANPVSGEYCLIAPFSSQCPDTACVTVVVNPVPTVTVSGISGGGDYCEGTDVSLSATVTISDNTPITYQWCVGNVPIPGQSGTVPSGTTVTLDLGQVELTDEGQYCLKLTSSNGCENTPPTCVQVNVNPTPEILTVTGGGTYCEGVDVSLNGTGTPGLGNVTYQWTGPNNFVFTSTGNVPSQGPFPATVDNISVLGEGVYVLTVTAGACSDTASVVVNVNPKPIITIISGPGTYCPGETVTFTFSVNPNGAASADWDFASNVFDTSGTVTTLTTISFDLVVTETVNATITAESSDGCEAEPQEIVAAVQTPPTPVISAAPSFLCPGENLVLTTTPVTDASYQWFQNGAAILNGTTNVPTFTLVPGVPGSYSVVVSVNGCVATSAPVVVTGPISPVAEDDPYTSNTPTPFSENVSTNDTGGTPVTYSVVTEPENGSVVLNQDGTFTYTPGEPVLPEVTFTYEICLTDCPDACSQALVTILYNIECEVPNIITPNGDLTNDNLVIDCLENNAFPNNRLRIFNRWGDEIQAFEPYENNWDGTYGSDKKDVPAATYFYLLEIDKNAGSGDDNVKSGYIKVVR